ncbi:MAG: hypothetical protein WD601_14105 [Pseudohongiellaceae bacterium]
MVIRPLIMLVMLLLPLSAPALILGDAQVVSGLDQALELQIPLSQLEGISLGELEVTIASPEDYGAFGLEYTPLLEFLEFSLSEALGSPVIYLNVESRIPIREPYLDIVLQVDWPGGTLQKAYTVLLSPAEA